MRIFYIIIFFTSFIFSGLLAQEEIGLKMIKDQCILGEELSFQIIVNSSKDVSEDFSEFKYNGKQIDVSKSITQMKSIQSINGKSFLQESIKSVYTFTFTPLQEGQIILPAMAFKINDKTQQTEPLTFNVRSMPFSDNFNTFINIKGKRDYYYPSEIIEVEVVFALKNYKLFVGSVPVMSGFNWLENQGLQNIPESEFNVNEKHKIMINSRDYIVRLRTSSETVPFGNYQAILCFPLKLRAINPGIYSVDNCIVKAQAGTGRYSNQVDFFGNRTQEAVMVYAKCKPIKFEIKPLPEKNRPNDFSGAIGNFTIEVVASSDTDLKVGDPITLHINIIGEGAWEFVNSPDLNKYPSITDFFRLNSEMPPGVVTEDGRRKEFNVKLRVKSTAVKEIPAISFSYFDIAKGQYITKFSKPIPIKVFENTNKVEVITFNNEENPPIKKDETVTEKPNITDSVKEPPLKPIEVMAIFKGNMLNENHQINYFLLYISYFCIFLVILIALVKRVLKSDAVEKAQVVVSIKKSNNKCIEKLTKLESHVNDGESIHKQISDCLDEFFKIKFIDKNCYNGLNTDSLLVIIKNGFITKDVGSKLLDVFEKWEALKFSKSEYNSEQVKSILIEFKKVISEC